MVAGRCFDWGQTSKVMRDATQTPFTTNTQIKLSGDPLPVLSIKDAGTDPTRLSHTSHALRLSTGVQGKTDPATREQQIGEAAQTC